MAANRFGSDTDDQEPGGASSASDARGQGVPADGRDVMVLGWPDQTGDKSRRPTDAAAALYRFTDRLYRALNPDDVYASALDAIAEALGCERASILMFDADGVMRFVAWRGLSEAYRRAVDGHSPWSSDTRDPQPICVDDVDGADFTDELKGTIKAEGIGALSFVPLVASGGLAGKFMTYYDRPHEFAQPEIDLALTIARQLSFSVERMRAEEARARAEQKLREGEERERARAVELQAIMHAVPALIWIARDSDCRTIAGNLTAQSFLRLPPGRNTSLSAPDGERPDHFEILADGRVLAPGEQPMQRAARGEDIRDFESEIRFRDGTSHHLLGNAVALRDSEQVVRGAVAAFVDITARKETERRLETLNNIARTLSSELDLERLVQKITDCATELCGAQFGAFFYNVTSARGESYLLYALSGVPREAFQRFGLPRNTPLFGPTFRGMGVVRSADIRRDPRYGRNPPHRGMPEGHLPVVSYLAVPVVSRSGEVHGGLFFGHEKPDVFTKAAEDIVAGIAAHAAIAIDNARLYQAAARLGAIVETSDDAIVSTDLAGVLKSWNRGAEKLYGYAADEVMGRPIAILLPPEERDEDAEIIERIKRGERINPYETIRRRKDGSLVEVSLTVSPLKDASGKIVGASKIARDITERKQAQARQELLTDEIQHRTKNLFAVVHAVVARSFAGKATIEEARTAVLSRLESLAQTHAMLMDKEWHGADLAEIVRAEMSPYLGRVTIDGPSLELSAKAAQNFAMALHELATNAAKYGALSNTVGQVHVHWRMATSNGAATFSFSWQERGGPTVMPPERKGFGTAVLEQVMAEFVGQRPEMGFEEEGFTYALECRLAAIAAA
jgi:PAS domain S-box-containing protein